MLVMKLFLSSMHPSNREALLDLLGNPDRPSVIIVPTGWDTYPSERKPTELEHVLTPPKGSHQLDW